MKRKREIRIKSPRLRALRDNLREILYLEWSRRSCDIIDAKSVVLDSMLAQDEKLILSRELEAKLGQNRVIIMPTIIVCGWCHHRDKDAIYNHSNHQWFCPDCYNEHKEEILNAESYIY